jgi:hypothetical protein
MREGNGSVVSAINPVSAMSVVDNTNLEPVAEQVRSKLKYVIDSLKNK